MRQGTRREKIVVLSGSGLSAESGLPTFRDAAGLWRQHMDEARAHVAEADKVLVVGTSLTVYPAAGLVDAARKDAERMLNALEIDEVPAGFEFFSGRATQIVPTITAHWLADA